MERKQSADASFTDDELGEWKGNCRGAASECSRVPRECSHPESPKYHFPVPTTGFPASVHAL